MKNILFLLSLSFIVADAFSQNSIYIADKIKVSFFSEARIENIQATSLTGCSAAINATSKEVAFKVSVLSFRFEHKLMEEHFNENYMESDKYPYGIFKGKIEGNDDFTKEGKYNVTVDGTLDVHGVSKTRQFTGVIENKGGRLYLDSEFMLPVADHNIKIPNDKLSNISQTIKVDIHAELHLKK